MRTHGKKYTTAKGQVENRPYLLADALPLVQKIKFAKFDETVELAFSLGVDAASGEQNVRGTTPLPNGSGKKVRVIVFTDDPKKALDSGADEAGLATGLLHDARMHRGWRMQDRQHAVFALHKSAQAGRHLFFHRFFLKSARLAH